MSSRASSLFALGIFAFLGFVPIGTGRSQGKDAEAPAGGQERARARAIFEQILSGEGDRSLLFEQLTDLGEHALPVLRSHLQQHVKRRLVQVDEEVVEEMIAIGGGAGGRFGGRAPLAPPTRHEDPLEMYRPTGDFEIAARAWGIALRPGRLELSREKDRERLVLEALRQLGPKSRPALPDLRKLTDALGSEYPSAFCMRALAAIGPEALPPLEQVMRSRTARHALALFGAGGVRVLLAQLEQALDQPRLAASFCRALADVPSWPEGVGANVLVEAAFHAKSIVRDTARWALWQHTPALRRDLNRLRAPEHVGSARERFAYTLLGMRLDMEASLRVLRRVFGRRRGATKGRRLVAYECLRRRADEIVAGKTLPQVQKLLAAQYEKAGDSVIERVGILSVTAALRRESAAPIPVQAFVLEALDAPAWQLRVAAMRNLGEREKAHALRVVAKIKDPKLDVRLEALDALARLGSLSDEAIVREVRAAIEARVLTFDTSDYGNAEGLLALASVRAIPCLGAEIGEKLEGFLAAELDKRRVKSWWMRAIFDALAGLGPRAAGLGDRLLARRETSTERLRALASVLRDDRRVLAVLSSKLVTCDSAARLAAFCAKSGTPKQVEAIAQACAKAPLRQLRKNARSLTGHAAFASLHMQWAESCEPDHRELPLECLRLLGAKAATVRPRLEKMLAAEKSRTRRAELAAVLAAIR